MAYATDYDQLTLQLYNLLFFYPSGIISLIFHFKNGYVRKDIAKNIIVLAVIGAILGSKIAININMETLRKMFALLLVCLGFLQLLRKNEKN